MSWRKGTFLMTAAFAGVAMVGNSLADDGPFSDNMEAYTANLPLSTQSPDWEPWCPNGPDGQIKTNFAHGGTKSYWERTDGSNASQDTVHRIVATTGCWELSAWMYHPTTDPNGGLSGATYWIILNQYMDANCLDINNWSAQINMNSSTNTITAEYGANAGGTDHGPLTMVKDAWVQIKTIVDLDNDLATTYYNGAALHENYIWSEGVSGAGLPTIECLDLFTFGGTMYWDDVFVGPIDCPGAGPTCATTGAWTNNGSSSGTVADTCGSDNVRTIARRATISPIASKLLTYDASGNETTLTPTTVTVHAEVSIDNAGVTNVIGRLQIKNQNTGVYATVGTAALSTTDVVISGNPSGAATQYINPTTGRFDVRVIFQQTVGAANWQGRIDDLGVDAQ